MEYSLVNSYDNSKDILTLKYHLKNFSDHVSPSDFPEFYRAMDKMNKNISYSLIYPKSGKFSEDFTSRSFGEFLGKLGFGFVMFIIIIIGIVKALSKSPNEYDRRNRKI